jgi:putative membrane protein insertion efficiency factor
MSILASTLRVVGWPFRTLLLLLIHGYRRFISPMLPPTCKYHPSCSAYAVTAVERHGAAKGALLAGWRLLRCNPFSLGGFDPVPERGRWQPDVYPDGRPRLPSHSTQRHDVSAKHSSEGA